MIRVWSVYDGIEMAQRYRSYVRTKVPVLYATIDTKRGSGHTNIAIVHTGSPICDEGH